MSKAPAISCIPSKGNPVSLAALDMAAAAFAFPKIFLRSASLIVSGPYPRRYLQGPNSSVCIGSLHPLNPTAPAMDDVLFLIIFSTLNPPA